MDAGEENLSDSINTNKWYAPGMQEAVNMQNSPAKGKLYETWTKLLEDPDWSQYS